MTGTTKRWLPLECTVTLAMSVWPGLFGADGIDKRHGDGAAVYLAAADFQPRLVAFAVGVNRLFLLRLDFKDVTQRIAGIAAQGDRFDADLDFRRRRQAQRLEELLHAGHAGRGRTLNRIGPAVGLVPGDHFAVLELNGRLFRDWPWPFPPSAADFSRRRGRRPETA